jgi:uncharacterized membrane protein YbaN (DUF454 family)
MAAWIDELRRVRDDRPGERFRNHRERMKRRKKWHSAIALAAGLVLIAVGIVLLFIPGPGTPLIVLGLALLSSHSQRIGDLMDRAEPKLRAAARRIAREWKLLPMRAKTGVVLAGAALIAAVGLWAWRIVSDHI